MNVIRAEVGILNKNKEKEMKAMEKRKADTEFAKVFMVSQSQRENKIKDETKKNWSQFVKHFKAKPATTFKEQ